ncbi:MAG: MarC family protein [Chitinophagales bacterium]|nr:MarC family protein [Bacteroidota bacterium]MCB9043315.1 MarC family protein [Chitinophagales bacterium]
MDINLKDIVTVSFTLFAVIDIFGSLPVLVDIKSKTGHIFSGKVTLISGLLMLIFLLFGESLLKFIGIDVSSFALAGSFIIFIIAMEMILGVSIFKSKDTDPKNATIVPIAFPLIAGAGTLTTILSLKSQYSMLTIVVGLLINLIIVYAVLKFVPLIEKKLGSGGIEVLRRVFGIILLAIAIKIFKSNLFWGGV